MLLLQITEIAAQAGPSMIQKLADQGLTLFILGVISWVLWKRQAAQDAKLDKYMEEDRKAMIEVIQKNTAAFEKVNSHFDTLK